MATGYQFEYRLYLKEAQATRRRGQAIEIPGDEHSRKICER